MAAGLVLGVVAGPATGQEEPPVSTTEKRIFERCAYVPGGQLTRAGGSDGHHAPIGVGTLGRRRVAVLLIAAPDPSGSRGVTLWMASIEMPTSAR